MSIKRVLLSDVAKLAGLSKATLSRYMNNSALCCRRTPSTASKPPFANWTIAAIAWHAVLAKAAAKRLAWCFPILPTPSLPNWPTQPKRPLLPAAGSLVLCITRNNPEKRVPVHSLAGYLPGRRSAVHHQPP
ncbi:LacI family DNA-binding transcriptional regulator [Klebsiella pneumoniae subsp. pneumoniae]|nr:LacI family DNA-binding transcriptional regulator [Klebsiella pneumoniae subsp. pneumoniae]